MKIFVNCVLTFLLLVYGSADTVVALEESACIDIRRLNTSWVNGLNNNVRVIDFNSSIKYFKEYKMKLDEMSEIKRII